MYTCRYIDQVIYNDVLWFHYGTITCPLHIAMPPYKITRPKIIKKTKNGVNRWLYNLPFTNRIK